MSTMLCKTKENANPQGKRRVYFTCHPEDFEKCFDKICNDIFASHDCAIYYTEDMTALIDEKNWQSDLESNNLFVIPVTYKLLTTPNRAMDFDFPFAKEKKISILPIMMEPGIDEIYSQEDSFGEMQYLNPSAKDPTAISYGDKLKKYLDIILQSDETVKRIRAAFDAYIFLSYRKKDRHLANQLMKLIHSNPEYRDVAIWFDEFLTPGESFRENINKILLDSKLFTLLVTPNLLEENNFVMREEYPAAKASGIDILPAEMEKTDRDALCEKFKDIPECAVTADEVAFRNCLLEEVSKLAIKENNTPEHNYLIGLAYLDGIDVEVDRERGFELIMGAAKQNHIPAMEKMVEMYISGVYVKFDSNEAIYWAQRLTDIILKKYGEEHRESIDAYNMLIDLYRFSGDYSKAIELSEKTYAICCKVLGEKHPDTLSVLNNIGKLYSGNKEYEKNVEPIKKAYSMRLEILGQRHPDTIESLKSLAVAYGNIDNPLKKLELLEKAYSLFIEVMGEEHSATICTLSDLAEAYGDMGEYEKSLELNKKAHTIMCRLKGEEHPYTISILIALANSYYDMGEYAKSIKLHKRAYYLGCKVLGDDHPDTQKARKRLSWVFVQDDEYDDMLAEREAEYRECCDTVGQCHPDTIAALRNIAYTYSEGGFYMKSIKIYEDVYSLYCENLGLSHPETIKTLYDIGLIYFMVGEYTKAIEIYEEVYRLRLNVLGEENKDTLIASYIIAEIYGEIGDYKKVLEIFENGYDMCCKVFDEESYDRMSVIYNMANANCQIGNYEASLELYQKLYPLYQKVYGEDHIRSTATKEKIDELKDKLGIK